MDHTIRYLPGEAVPDGVPVPKLTDTQHVEVYGLGALRAVVVIETKNDKHVIKTSWLSQQDSDLARQLMSVVQERYIIPGKGLLFHVDASQPALLDELNGFPLRAQIMSKQVDVAVKLPSNISYRDMTAAEARDYFKEVEDAFMDEMLKGKSEHDDDKDVRERTHAMVASIAPDGPDTPGHKFLIIEDAGTAVSTLWIGERSTKQSFCFNAEVQKEKRSLGYGRKTLLVWEHAAANLGLTTLGLNVFGTNISALKLYTGGGFRVDDATYTLDGHKKAV